MFRYFGVLRAAQRFIGAGSHPSCPASHYSRNDPLLSLILTHERGEGGGGVHLFLTPRRLDWNDIYVNGCSSCTLTALTLFRLSAAQI